jgi:hypothetical protein
MARVDDRQIRALIVARGFLDQGELAGSNATDHGAMSAVVLFDLAVETAAKGAMIGHARPAGRKQLGRDPRLPDVLTALTELWQARERREEEPSEIAEVRRLHDQRNNVQHDSATPVGDDVTRARLRASGFITWVAETWLGVPLEAVSRAILIEHPRVREQVERAQRHAAEDDYNTAGEALAMAFEHARSDFRWQRGRTSPFERFTSSDVRRALGLMKELIREIERPGSRDERAFEKVFTGIVRQLERLNDQVEVLSLGARASDYLWFGQNFPNVYGAFGTEELFVAGGHRAISREMYVRGLDFVVAAALHWQQFPEPPAFDEEGREQNGIQADSGE